MEKEDQENFKKLRNVFGDGNTRSFEMKQELSVNSIKNRITEILNLIEEDDKIGSFLFSVEVNKDGKTSYIGGLAGTETDVAMAVLSMKANKEADIDLLICTLMILTKIKDASQFNLLELLGFSKETIERAGLSILLKEVKNLDK